MVADRGGQKWVPARRAAGLPDLFMLHADPPRLIIAEVKGTGGKLSDAQREFLTLARGVGDLTSCLFESVPYEGFERAVRSVGVYVFEPGMEDAIEQMLRTRVLM